MDYDSKYIEYVEQYRHIVATVVAVEVRRRRIVAALAMMNLLKKKRPYKKKKYWVAPLFKNRSEHGFFFASVPKLLLEDIRFHNYFRMTATQLGELLDIVQPNVGPKLQKQDIIRQSITPPERLALTLRFV